MQLAVLGSLVSVAFADSESVSDTNKATDTAVHIYSGPEHETTAVPTSTEMGSTTTSMPSTSTAIPAETEVTHIATSKKELNAGGAKKDNLTIAERLKKFSAKLSSKIGGIFNRTSNATISHKKGKVVA
jgi:hypothetical protein